MACSAGAMGCGWRVDQTFDCPICEQTVCYCEGCCLGDGLDDLCDVCWAAVTLSPIAAAIASKLDHDTERALFKLEWGDAA